MRGNNDVRRSSSNRTMRIRQGSMNCITSIERRVSKMQKQLTQSFSARTHALQCRPRAVEHGTRGSDDVRRSLSNRTMQIRRGSMNCIELNFCLDWSTKMVTLPVNPQALEDTEKLPRLWHLRDGSCWTRYCDNSSVREPFYFCISIHCCIGLHLP